MPTGEKAVQSPTGPLANLGMLPDWNETPLADMLFLIGHRQSLHTSVRKVAPNVWSVRLQPRAGNRMALGCFASCCDLVCCTQIRCHPGQSAMQRTHLACKPGRRSVPTCKDTTNPSDRREATPEPANAYRFLDQCAHVHLAPSVTRQGRHSRTREWWHADRLCVFVTIAQYWHKDSLDGAKQEVVAEPNHDRKLRLLSISRVHRRFSCSRINGEYAACAHCNVPHALMSNTYR